jgi:hypothetical protein
VSGKTRRERNASQRTGVREMSQETAVRETSEQPTAAFSGRSQRSIVVEAGLRKEIRKAESFIDRFQKKLGPLEESKAFLTNRIIAHEENTLQPQLDATVTEIANVHGVIRAYQEERERTIEAVQKLNNPDPLATQARLAQQQQLAQLVSDRLDKDRELDGLIREARKVLGQRSALTEEMKKPLAALELVTPQSDLETRLEKLAASLPDDLLSASERWHLAFLGKEKDARPYVVADEYLLRPETLTHNGLYKFGDTIYLSAEEAAKLLRADRPATDRRNVWTYSAPAIMTIEAFEAVTREAKEKGISAQDVCFWKSEVEFDAIAKARYMAEKKMSPPAVEPIARLESTMKVRGRAKTRLVLDRQYEAGELVEVTGKPQAWSLVESGAIGPP